MILVFCAVNCRHRQVLILKMAFSSQISLCVVLFITAPYRVYCFVGEQTEQEETPQFRECALPFRKSPKDALSLGIGMVHQHFKLIDVLSATENIILGLDGKLNIKEASKRIEEICNKYGFEVDPAQKIYDMSVSQKQTVEIVKVLRIFLFWMNLQPY